MSTYLLFMLIGAVVLLVVWRWDERARRAALDRRRQFLRMQPGSRHDGTPAAALPGPGPTAAGQRLG